MEKHADIASLRVVGGSLALDFLNTRMGPPTGEWEVDALADYDSLVAWALHVGEITPADADALRLRAERDASSARESFAVASGARDYLDGAFRGLARGEQPTALQLDRLKTDEADALHHAALEGSPRLSWSWRGDSSLLRPLHPVFHSAVELLTLGRLDRVEVCAGCSFLFVDSSKNGSRRWCSMSDCGTTAKAQRYVETRRSRSVTHE